MWTSVNFHANLGIGRSINGTGGHCVRESLRWLVKWGHSYWILPEATVIACAQNEKVKKKKQHFGWLARRRNGPSR